MLTIAKAVQLLVQNKSLTMPSVTNGLCSPHKQNVEPWIDGETLLEEMKSVRSSVFWVFLYDESSRSLFDYLFNN